MNPQTSNASGTTIRFTKMHGLGNDFMVLNLVTQGLEPTTELIRAWGDRQTGVGFDQLLLLQPPSHPEVDFDYRIFNADGTEAEQCGNGARCMAKFIMDEGLSKKTTHTLWSLAGEINVAMLDDDTAEVDMGAPTLEPERIPFTGTEPTGEPNTYRISANPITDITVVSMGNPHGVIFVDNITEAPVAEVGAALTRHDWFPEGANIGFCQIVDRRFARLRVFERGVGETRACGSGACAAIVAARLLNKLGSRAKISLPGGKVRLSWQGPGTPVKMIGPAVSVFQGTICTNPHLPYVQGAY